MSFDPWAEENFALKVRNLIDSPAHEVRGGGFAKGTIEQTGLPIKGKLPAIKTLPNAEVRFTFRKIPVGS